jgi:hypothetical protein
MKSGNVIVLDDIIECTVNYRGNEVTGLRIQNGFKSDIERLMVGTVDLTQIEAVSSIGE